MVSDSEIVEKSYIAGLYVPAEKPENKAAAATHGDFIYILYIQIIYCGMSQ